MAFRCSHHISPAGFFFPCTPHDPDLNAATWERCHQPCPRLSLPCQPIFPDPTHAPSYRQDTWTPSYWLSAMPFLHMIESTLLTPGSSVMHVSFSPWLCCSHAPTHTGSPPAPSPFPPQGLCTCCSRSLGCSVPPALSHSAHFPSIISSSAGVMSVDVPSYLPLIRFPCL